MPRSLDGNGFATNFQDDLALILTAVLLRPGQRIPAAFTKLLISFFKTCRSRYNMPLVLATFFIATAINWVEYVFRKLGALLKNGVV